MDLKTEIEQITVELNKARKDINKLLLMSRIMAVIAHLQDDKTEVAAAVFAGMDAEGRKLALQGFFLIICQTLDGK